MHNLKMNIPIVGVQAQNSFEIEGSHDQGLGPHPWSQSIHRPGQLHAGPTVSRSPHRPPKVLYATATGMSTERGTAN